MKKIVFVFLISSFLTRADEGMWMPQLIAALNYADMQKNGLKLTAQQIYSVNKASMKDAVVLFGGGCTAEVISDKGLILTNHHCGFSAIAAMSTVQHDYLKNGFWAMKQEEEMWCKDLSVTFIKRIDDVTHEILSHIQPGYTELQRDSAIQATIKEFEIKKKEETKTNVIVRPFYYGNEFYMFTIEVYKDVRLVGAPPESIGKFGGETDNWMWPRHNADFSMFRIYAGKDNKPATHSDENIPYKPSWSFPISLKGVEKGDFTMVYGFPGRTQEYLSSYAVDFIMNLQDPLRVALRGIRLKVIEADMKKNDTIRLMYTGRHASLANYYKKWDGEMQGLKRSDALNVKRAFEKKLTDRVMKEPEQIVAVSEILRELKQNYAEYAPYAKAVDLYTEGLLGIEAVRMINNLVAVFNELKLKQNGKTNNFEQRLKESTPSLPFANFNRETDRKLCKAVLDYYFTATDKSERPNYLDSVYHQYKENVALLTDYLYDNSALVDDKKAGELYSNFEARSVEIMKDPLYVFTSEINKYYVKKILPVYGRYEVKILKAQKEYMKFLRETLKERKFYPDANGTLRIAYGKVSEYKPRDGVEYGYFTTVKGIAEKHSSMNEDYAVPLKFLDLTERKDFGAYADKNGNLRVAFIASNHTTGGNSGSPVLNGNGELIGTNFDRDWEGTMSDIMYNPGICRNIVLDVRYTLWIVDKYAGAGYLLKEMKIVR